MRSKRLFLNVLPPTVEGGKDTVDYKDFLLFHLGKSRAEGYSIAQIRSRLSLIESLKAAESFWDIEHREYESLLKELENEKWLHPSANIVRFIDDFRDAPDAIVADNMARIENEKVLG